METDWSRSGLYRTMVGEEFGYHKWLVQKVDDHLRSEKEGFWSSVDDEAKSIANPDDRGDLYLFYLDDALEFDHLHQMAMSATFVASYASFEFRAALLCDYIQRRNSDPIGVRDSGRFTLDKAKQYLTKHGVKRPFGGAEWKNAQRYRRIRNAIVHEGGSINPDADLADYLKNQDIVHQQAPAFTTGLVHGSAERSPLQLRITKSFCEEAFETLKGLLCELFEACEEASNNRDD